MAFIKQWRMPILFVISGMETRFALSYKSGKQYRKERFKRLFIPLLFGMFVIVPPQSFERLTQGQDYSSFLQFYPHYFNGIYPKGNFSWHHLWFLPYLLTMSILATPLFLFLRKEKNAIIQKTKVMMETVPISLYLAILPLITIKFLLANKYVELDFNNIRILSQIFK